MTGCRRADPSAPASIASSDRSDYLLTVLATLWPAPAQVEHVRRGRKGSSDLEFVVLPHVRRPTLVVPRRPRAAAAAVVSSYKTAADTKTRLKLLGLGLATRVGLADLLPDRVRITPARAIEDHEPADIAAYLTQALGRDVLVSLYVGPDRGVQKPVLRLLSPSGETLGFAKIGTNTLTRELVRGEADVLTFLNAAALEHLVAPTVLHRGTWKGHEVLVQQPLSGSGADGVDRALLVAAMVELADVSGRSVHPLTDSPYWTALGSRLEKLPASAYTELLTDTVDQLAQTGGSTSIAFGAWHGDWAPWNMTVADGRIQAWDWEHFGLAVPVGFDAVHFAIQEQLVTYGLSAADSVHTGVARAADLLEPVGVRREDADLVALLYLIEIATRYVHDGEVDAGTRMGNLDSWLAAALALQLRSVAVGAG